MHISEFVRRFHNHPVLFVGTGISLRYLKSSYTWDGLLKYITDELTENPEIYLDIKSQSQKNDIYQYDVIASKVGELFNQKLTDDRNGKFKFINDQFYELMTQNQNIPRFKLYISHLLNNLEVNDERVAELNDLKKIGKNIGSVITTNYDQFIETTLNFNPLVGNNILLSNPYGSVYKIHGCITEPAKIIITDNDYSNFDTKYELIRAQLLSLFIHNPIIFLGYNVGDENIKKILRTIFSYVEPNSELALKIRSNFLLVEYENGSNNEDTSEHDIDIQGYANTIRINKIKTDNYSAIYKALSDLTLPISAMDIRKVQTVVKDLYAGGSIQVKIVEDLDSVPNSERILAIGSSRSIKYEYHTFQETINNYFDLIDEENVQILELIGKYKIAKTAYFPIYGFASICENISNKDELKTNQKNCLTNALNRVPTRRKISQNTTISEIISNERIPESYKNEAIFYCIINDYVTLDDAEIYLRSIKLDNTAAKQILCAYDIKKYSTDMDL